MKIVILGAPGSGKDTAAKKIEKKFRLNQLVLGDYFKQEYKNKTKIGKAAYKYWSKGILCPDKLVIQIIKKNLNKDNYLLNGFPRNIKQANFLNKINKPNVVIYLDVPKKILIKRLLDRAKIENRLDDEINVIRKRLTIYNTKTRPLIKFYKSILIKINGNRKPESIFKDIKTNLDRLKK